MTKNRLYRTNRRRAKRGKPLLNGNKWDLTLANQAGPIQANIPKTQVYKIERPTKKRDEKIARLTDDRRYVSQPLWVHSNRRPLDRLVNGFTLRELQEIGSKATIEHIEAMIKYMNR